MLKAFERWGAKTSQTAILLSILTASAIAQAQAKDERAPEVLLDGLSEARFSFRGLDENGNPGSWQPSWPQTSQMPPVVRLSVRFADPRKHWPDLIVPLRLAPATTPSPVELR